MRIEICPNVELIAPLESGVNLAAGDVVEIRDDVAADWIQRGWAVATAPPEKEA